MRNTVKIIILLFPLAAIASGEMQQIKILNNEFSVIKVISSTKELELAKKEWGQLIPINKLPNTNWTHKIDITSKSIGGRWLYNKQGYLAKLNKQLKPMYKTNNVKSFNKVYLGL